MNNAHMDPALTRGDESKIGSDRSFGLVFAGVFALIGVWPALHLGWSPRLNPSALRLWSLAIAVVFLAMALLYPSLLHGLNRIWLAFGEALGKIMSPVVMGLLFVVTVVPTGLMMRLAGRDQLRLKIDRETKSYWIIRDPPGPGRDSMSNQF
jgi:hypothetical protein